MERAQKALEVRLRTKAERQRLILTRSRRRSPDAIGYGKYFLWSASGKKLITSDEGLTLDEIERHLR